MKKMLLILFLNLSFAYAQNIDSLKQMVQQADDQSKVKAMIRLSNHYFYSKPDSALFYIQKGLALAKERHFTKYELKMMNLLGIFYNEQGNYKRAKEVLDKTYRLAMQSNDTLSMISALGNLGNNRLHVGKFDEAINYYTRIAGMYKKLGNIKGMAKVYGAMGNMYREMHKNDKALEYYNRSQKKFLKVHDTVSSAILMLNSSFILIKMNQIKQAEHSLQNAYQIFQRKHINLNAAKCLEGLAKINIKKKQYDKALQYSLQALDIFKKVHSKTDLSLNYSYLAKIYIAQKNYKNAEKYLLMAYRLDSTEHIYNRLEDISANLKKVYDSMGDIKNAYRYANKYVTYHDSVYNIQANKKFAELEAKYETAEKQRKIEKLESKRKLDKARFRNMLISGISLILLLLIVTYIIVQKRKKQKEIAELELEKSRIRSQSLSEQLELKNKQLTTHALNMMQKNQLLSAFGNNLSEIAREVEGAAKTKLKRLKREVQHLLNSEKDWDTFKVYFEQVNKEFLQKIKQINPELTQTDLRLATLLKLNMTNKEIGSILNITHQSVRNAQYRLKNKLALAGDIDLRDFIGSL